MTEIELAEGVSSLPRDEWNALVGDESPFLEWEWLASLEEAGTLGAEHGWLSQPLVAREGGRIVAACPMYVKGNSEGEFVFDHAWADAAERGGLPYYPKLLVGVPFTPVSGARLLVAPDADRALWQRRLAQALVEIAKSNELSSVHVNFCREDELAALEDHDFLVRVGIQYHWLNRGYADFEAYLGAFRSKRRNQIRRERRDVAAQGVHIEALTGDEIGDDLFEPMYRFYRATVDVRMWGRPYLNRELFELARERFRDRLVFVVARDGPGGAPLGGTFNVRKGDALYGRYWGAGQYVRNLHFEVCYYAAVQYCIEHGLARFEPGAGGEYKQMRGFDAQPTWSAHAIRDPRLREAVGRFLEAERQQAEETIDWLHERSQLKSTSQATR